MLPCLFLSSSEMLFRRAIGSKSEFTLEVRNSPRPGIAEVGYSITVSPVLQLGFILLMKLRTFAWLYSSSPNYC
jgi:hypothetical protein